MIIAVDFDGCLSSDGCWPDVGKPNVSLFCWLIQARKQGDKVILWTCREGNALQKAIDFCKKQGLIFDAVNDNLEELQRYYGNNSRKVFADLYIDDKALKVMFPGKGEEEMT